VQAKAAPAVPPRSVWRVIAPPAAAALSTPFVVQTKKPNRKREQEKTLRKAMRVQVQAGTGTPTKMHATATRGKSSVSSESGSLTTETQQIGAYIDNNPGWPWDDKGQVETWPLKTCAEARLYAKLVMNGENPRKYNLISYNSAGKVAPPCRNCKTWVGSAFASVKMLTAAYRSGATHSPV
jgi:hypothetical protein